MASFLLQSLGWRRAVISAILLISLVTPSLPEECKTGSDLDEATRSALESTAKRFFDLAASGNATELQQNSIPDLANSFGGVQAAINDNKANFGGAPTVRGVYELDAPGTGSIERAEFYCGIVNSSDWVGFFLNNLPPGRYGLAIMDAKGGKEAMTVSMILQQYASQQWKLAGFYARPASLAGHDGQWYLAQARQYKTKGQNHNAWLYYLTAWNLQAPVPFMSNGQLGKISEEMQSAKPTDFPGQQPVTLAAAGKSYSVTQLFTVPVQDGLGLVVKFQVPYDVSNTSKAYGDNMDVIKALIARYPEFRDAFSSVVARAVAPSGQDYGTLLAMKDVK